MNQPTRTGAGTVCWRILGAAVAAVSLHGAALAQAPSAKAVALDNALDAAMTPGEGQQRLEPMIGSFNVRMRTWADPSKPPVESVGSAVTTWVLGKRYAQMMMSIGDPGTPFSGIGYFGYDNAAKLYQAAWMDNGSTGMVWYSGKLDAAGKSAVMKATVTDPVSGKPSPLELRLSILPNGEHASELWGTGLGTKMFKMIELHYTRAK